MKAVIKMVISVGQRVTATPEQVYRAFATPGALERWLPPGDMTGEMLHFDFRSGGSYRMRLRYRVPPAGGGKTTADSDEVEVRLTRVEEGKCIEQEIVFLSDDPALAGTMRMTWTFEPDGEGAVVKVCVANVPPGIEQSDHMNGISLSLQNLADYVESGGGGGEGEGAAEADSP